MVSLADFWNQLSLSHLFDDPAPVASSIYVDLLFLLGAVAALGCLFALRPGLFASSNALHERILRQYGGWLAWLSVAGVFAVGLRYTNAPFFSKRIWIVLDTLALLAVAAHFVTYRLTRYPRDRALLEEEERRRRFRTGPPAPSRRKRRR